MFYHVKIACYQVPLHLVQYVALSRAFCSSNILIQQPKIHPMLDFVSNGALGDVARLRLIVECELDNLL